MLDELVGQLLLFLQQMIVLSHRSHGGIKKLEGHLADINRWVVPSSNEHCLDNVTVTVLWLGEDSHQDISTLLRGHCQVIGADSVTAVLGVEDGSLGEIPY